MPDTISKSYTIKDSGNANILAKVNNSGELYTSPYGVTYPITNLPSGTGGYHSPFTFNQDNGALVTQIPNLERTADTITAYTPASSTLISGNIPGIRTGIGTVLNANQRNIIFLQNVGVNPILVALTGTAAPNNFNFILKGGTTTLDGNGASWSSSNWFGGISVSGSGISYTSFEY